MKLKPHYGPCGLKSRPAKKAISWKRVLRGVPVTGTAKRRQRVKGPCNSASKGKSSGSRDGLIRRRQYRGAKHGNRRNEAPATVAGNSDSPSRRQQAQRRG